MPKVRKQHQGNIVLLRMNSEVTNAIGTELVNDLSIALEEIRKEAAGFVLSETGFAGLNRPLAKVGIAPLILLHKS